MPHETLREIARCLVANYRLKRGGSPCRLVNEKLAESIAHGAAIAQLLPPPPSPEEIAKRLAEDRAFLFDLTLTDADIAYLRIIRIDPCQ